MQVSPESVWRQLCGLDPSKSTGPDHCHPRIFREIKVGVLRPLFLLFKRSLEEGQLPTAWKEAMVIPIFKKGSRTQPTNYRPVSLTSIACKMLESIIKDSLVHYFTVNNLFSINQHGFRAGFSCVTQLLKVLEDWTVAIDSGKSVDVIYLDFQKAFDRVPHNRLLSKLRSYGIGGNLFGWIRNFLSNRKQCVSIRGSCSNWSDITSGVPQGSVLGPILFITFINDLPESVLSSVFMFADDTKLYYPIKSPQDNLIMQQDLDNLVEWCEKWQMFFNIDKCHVMSLGHSPVLCDYTLNSSDSDLDTPITRVEEERDLGILFTPNLKFDKHISNIIRKANNLIGVIKRSFSCLDPPMFQTLYTTLIRPHLEYASVIWNPCQLGNARSIEKIQRRATRIVPQLRNIPYHDRLNALDLPSLLYRRRFLDMVMVYKIIHGLDGAPFDDFFSYHNISTRSNGFKLYKHFSRLNVRKFSFSQRVINDWNNLPMEVVQTSNVILFKAALHNFWECHKFDFH